MPHDRGIAMEVMELASVKNLLGRKDIDERQLRKQSLNNHHRAPALQERCNNDNKRSTARTTWNEFFFHLVVVFVLLLSLRTLLFQEPPAIGILCLTSAWLAVSVALQQHRLTDLRLGATAAQVRARRSFHALQRDCAALERDNGALLQHAERLQELERNLQEACQLRGQNLRVLMEQVENYRKGRQQQQQQQQLPQQQEDDDDDDDDHVQEDDTSPPLCAALVQTKDATTVQIMKTLLRVVRYNAQDDAYVMDPTEATLLLPELWAMDGVRFSELLFRKAILRKQEKDNSSSGTSATATTATCLDMQGLLAVMKNLLDRDLSHQEKIFTY